MKVKGIIYTALSALMYGFTPALASMTYKMGNNGLSMTFYRNLFVIPVLLILIRKNKIDMKVKKAELRNIGLLGIFGVATTIFLYSSYTFIGVGTTTTLHFMYPVFVALICKVAFKEHMGKKKIVALVLAWLGVLFFMDFRYVENLLGIFMAIASSLTFALYMVFMEKKGLVKINTYLLTLYLAIFATIVLIIGNVFWGYIVVGMTIKAYILMVIVSLCTSLLATIFIQKGVKEIGSSSAAIFSLFEPITSVAIGGLLLKEQVSLSNIVGCTIIFAAITYLAVMNTESKKKLGKASNYSI